MKCSECPLECRGGSFIRGKDTSDGRRTWNFYCPAGNNGGCPNPTREELEWFDREAGKVVGASPQTPPLQMISREFFIPATKSWRPPKLDKF